MLHRYRVPTRLLCQAGLLALCATTVLAVDQTAPTTQTMQPGPAVAPATAMDRIDADLSDALRSVTAKYEDIRKDLQEEYAQIRQDREDRSNEITERVRQLKENHKKEVEKLDADYKDFQAKMHDSRIPESDQQFIEQAVPFTRQRETENRTYETMLSNLHRLYRLTDQRYHEMVRIHEAKENLEEQYYRQQRDIVADRTRLENRINSKNVTDAQKKSLDARLAVFNIQASEVEARYKHSQEALDDMQNLVEDRIDRQRDYLNDHQSIMQNIAQADYDPAKAAEYTKQLHDLQEKREIDERQYQTNLRYLQERLTMEQIRDRELAQIDNLRATMERRWTAQEQEMQGRLQALDNRIRGSNITDAERERLQGQYDQMKERIDSQKQAYDDTLNLIDQRRNITEKILDQRLSYLKDRNDLRLRIAEGEVNGADLADIRRQIAALEDKRMDEERDLRNQRLELRRSVPAIYNENSWFGRGIRELRERRLNRIERRTEQLKERYNARKDRLQRRIEIVQSGIRDDMPASDRIALEDQINLLRRRHASLEERYQRANAAILERKQLEEARLNARNEYIAKREELLKQVEIQSASYSDLEKMNQSLKNLDDDYEQKEQQYRQTVRPLQDLLPDNNAADDWQQQTEENWRTAVQNAEMKANQAVQETRADVRIARDDADRAADETGVVDRARAEYREGEEKVMGGLRWLGTAIRDGYHDVVDYFKD